jgi:hypothetical protein
VASRAICAPAGQPQCPNTSFDRLRLLSQTVLGASIATISFNDYCVRARRNLRKSLDDLDVLKPSAIDEVFLLAVAILAVRGSADYGVLSSTLPPSKLRKGPSATLRATGCVPRVCQWAKEPLSVKVAAKDGLPA